MRQQKYIFYGLLCLLLIVGVCVISAKLLNRSVIRKDIPLDDVDYTCSIQDSSVFIGKQLFNKNCAACHTVFKDVTGPALAGVEKRWNDKKELMAYIRNWAAVSLKNPNVRALRKRYFVRMTIFQYLTDKEIQSILDYIAFEEKKGTPVPKSSK